MYWSCHKSLTPRALITLSQHDLYNTILDSPDLSNVPVVNWGGTGPMVGRRAPEQIAVPEKEARVEPPAKRARASSSGGSGKGKGKGKGSGVSQHHSTLSGGITEGSGISASPTASSRSPGASAAHPTVSSPAAGLGLMTPVTSPASRAAKPSSPSSTGLMLALMDSATKMGSYLFPQSKEGDGDASARGSAQALREEESGGEELVGSL